MIIYETPLDTASAVGLFKRDVLVCDTEILIHQVRWAILHHMMYEPLKLGSIPQAWIMLGNGQESMFERKPVNEEFKKRMETFMS